jgi:hypothetical protein
VCLFKRGTGHPKTQQGEFTIGWVWTTVLDRLLGLDYAKNGCGAESKFCGGTIKLCGALIKTPHVFITAPQMWRND